MGTDAWPAGRSSPSCRRLSVAHPATGDRRSSAANVASTNDAGSASSTEPAKLAGGDCGCQLLPQESNSSRETLGTSENRLPGAATGSRLDCEKVAPADAGAEGSTAAEADDDTAATTSDTCSAIEVLTGTAGPGAPLMGTDPDVAHTQSWVQVAWSWLQVS